MLNLLRSPDIIGADLSCKLSSDPIRSLFACDLDVEKATATAAPSAIPQPRTRSLGGIRKVKKDRTAEYAVRNAKRAADKAARERAKAEGTVVSTEPTTTTTTIRPPVVDSADGLDKQSSFTLFESGWILAPDQKRNKRKARVSTPVTLATSASIASGPSSTSTAPSGMDVDPPPPVSGTSERTCSLPRSTTALEEGMDVDPPPPSSVPGPASGTFHKVPYGTRRQSKLEAEAGTSEPCEEEEFSRAVREQDGTEVIEVIETPASRKERAKKNKERRIRERVGASQPVVAEENPARVAGDVEMAQDLPDEEVPPPPLPPPPPVDIPPALKTVETPPIPRPPYQPLPRQYSARKFKSFQNRIIGTPEATAMLARGRMKESEALPDTLVWVKGPCFPWFPSVIVSKDDWTIPHGVHKAGLESANQDKYLIKYYDRDGSWQYAALKDMVKMFEDEILDQDLLAENSAVQRWRRLLWLDRTREAYAYVKQQWLEPYGGPTQIISYFDEDEFEEAQPVIPLPEVTTVLPALPPESRSIPKSSLNVATLEQVNWLRRSDLVLVHKTQTFEIDILAQTDVIKEVLRRAVHLAHVDLIFHTSGTSNPFNTEHLEKICLDACIKSARQLGYNAQGDIEHRLIGGDHEAYSTPMKRLVAQQMQIQRTRMKNDAHKIFATALHINLADSQWVKRLLEDDNYKYLNVNGEIDKSQPYQHPGFAQIIKTMFFEDTLNTAIVQKNANAFHSCISDAPHELEIPPSMLAWAATATHAILDQADGQSNKFGEKFEGPFRRHVVVLEAVRSRKPVIYHKFAHKFYMEAS